MNKKYQTMSHPLQNYKLIWLAVIILFTIMITVTTLYLLKSEKIAYIDSAKVLSEYKGAAVVRKEYETKVKTWQSNIDTLTMEVQDAIKQYEKDLSRLSAKEQQLSKQLIGEKQKKLQEYQQAIQENARQEDGKLTQGVVAEINSFLKEYGKKHNYKLILIANQSGTIAYAEDGLDITEDLITELNKHYEGNK